MTTPAVGTAPRGKLIGGPQDGLVVDLWKNFPKGPPWPVWIEIPKVSGLPILIPEPLTIGKARTPTRWVYRRGGAPKFDIDGIYVPYFFIP